MNKKVVSIFSGIDCLGLGFRKEFDIILAVEQMQKACQTLEVNKNEFHPNMKIVNKDIFSIDDEFIKGFQGVDGIIGGPPCQPFSSAKNQFDPNDERISGLAEYIRWVKLINPQFFMFENTDGLTTKNKKYLLDDFIQQLQNLKYNVYCQVLNSHDYGSVQKRKRVIVVGFREDSAPTTPYKFPEPIPSSKRRYVKDVIFLDEEVGECLSYSEERKFIASHIPEGGNWKSITDAELLKRAMGANANPEKQAGGMTGAYRRLSMADGYACPTITTNPCQRNTMCIHPTQNRPLSIKEYKRIQGIPDNYKLVGSINDKYKFIGNGVPVEMATAIAESIAEYYLTSYPREINISITEKSNQQQNLNICIDNTDEEETYEFVQMSLF